MKFTGHYKRAVSKKIHLLLRLNPAPQVMGFSLKNE
jgi:hypothetical protein